MKRATAIARANIALAKYWGKSDSTHNLPAVPSVSVTLDPLRTETTVSFEPGLGDDSFALDGRAASDKELGRVRKLLDEVRALAGIDERARVESVNHFPTAAGLASSASGFAALAGAACAAAGVSPGEPALSAMARRASASAARSIYGGFVELPRGEPGDDALAARPVAGADHWDLRVIVAVTAPGRKPVGSRDAMEESRRSSVYYDAWIAAACRTEKQIVEAILARDFDTLAPLAEQSFLAMHAVAMTSIPAVHYWLPASVAALAAVRELRADGVPVFATMDAGPHVKAVCLADAEAAVCDKLRATEGVLDLIVARPGPGLEVTTS